MKPVTKLTLKRLHPIYAYTYIDRLDVSLPAGSVFGHININQGINRTMCKQKPHHNFIIKYIIQIPILHSIDLNFLN